MACNTVQGATGAGVVLKLRPEAIEAIPAMEYPLPAPGPMNSRMARAALEVVFVNALGSSANVPKLQLLQQSWEPQVEAYVRDLVYRKLT